MIKTRTKTLIISVLLITGLFSKSVWSGEAEGEPPLRMAPDRNKLIDMISDEKLLDEIKPLSEESAEIYKQRSLENKKIQQMPPHDPKPMYRMISIDKKKPRAQQDNKMLYLSPEYATTLIFTDRSGSKWPIKNYTLSLGEKVIHSVVGKGTFTFQPTTQFARGNLVVMLEGANKPVTLTVVVGAKKLDYEATVRLDGYAPDNKPKFSGSGNGGSTNNLSSMANFTEDDMLQMLQGYTPNDSYEKKQVNDSNTEVWAKDKMMFVRTQDELLSPSLIKDDNNRLSDVSGNTIYAIPYTPSLVLLRQGQSVEVRVK